MSVASILADGLGLMMGSLLAAGCLTLAAWWLADRMHRAWLAPVVLALVMVLLLASPLEASLFVRMVAVFGLVGAGLLWFVGHGAAASPGEHEGRAGAVFRADP
jgi:hypothetical protein